MKPEGSLQEEDWPVSFCLMQQNKIDNYVMLINAFEPDEYRTISCFFLQDDLSEMKVQ